MSKKDKDDVDILINEGGGAIDAWKSILQLKRFISPHRGAIIGGFLILIFQAIANLAKPWPLKFAIDDLLTRENLDNDTMVLIVLVGLLVVVIAAVDGLFGYLLALVLQRAGRTVVFEVRVALFERLHSASLQFHSHKSSGDLMTRLTSDVKALRTVLTESVAEILNSFVFLIGMAIVLFWLDWQLASVALFAAPFLFLTVRYFTPRVKAYSRAERQREGQLSEVVHESLGTMKLSRTFGQQDAVKKKFKEESGASLRYGVKGALKAEGFAWIVDVIGAIVTGVVLGFGVRRVMQGAMTAGDLVVFVTYIRTFWKPMRTAVKHTSKLTRASAQIDRVVELLEEKSGVEDAPDAVPAPHLDGAIRFSGVDFDYGVGTSALSDVDLDIGSGEVVAIVGPTGAGKSTLISLIPRLYDATTGSIEFGGVDARRYTAASVRSQISVVPQESVLLRASIRENIAYGRPEATAADIMAAAIAAEAHDFIEELPDGYETVVGQRGETLSGGQRQRIAIARALVRDAPILILDEPLVGLDAESADTVMSALRSLMEGRTVLIVTHQLSMISAVDRVIVMEDGSIVQDGTHDELMALGGRYRDLFESSTRVPQSKADA